MLFLTLLKFLHPIFGFWCREIHYHLNGNILLHAVSTWNNIIFESVRLINGLLQAIVDCCWLSFPDGDDNIFSPNRLFCNRRFSLRLATQSEKSMITLLIAMLLFDTSGSSWRVLMVNWQQSWKTHEFCLRIVRNGRREAWRNVYIFNGTRWMLWISAFENWQC